MVLDTSVIVAYYLEESYSAQVQGLYRQDDDLMVSDLVVVEAFSVLSRLVRTGSISVEYAQRIGAMLDEHLEAGLYGRVPLEPAHYRWARDTVARFDLPLKAPDALHLAAAAIGGHRLVTADRQLARNAEALRVAVDLIGA